MRSNCGYNVLTGDQRAGVHVPPHEVYNPYEYNATQNAGREVVFGSRGKDKGYGLGGYKEERKYAPQEDYNEYNEDKKEDYVQPEPATYSYAKAPAPVKGVRQSSRGGGIQLPIAAKDYSAFGGGAKAEGAGIGMGYSQPMQSVGAPTQNFVGGAGTKFY